MEEIIEDPANQKSEREDKASHRQSLLRPPFFDDHEEIGQARNKESDGHQADHNLNWVEFSRFGQDKKTGSAVVSAQEPHEEYFGGSGRQTKKPHHDRLGHILDPLEQAQSVAGKKEDGSQKK
jgi:hypothetical protein